MKIKSIWGAGTATTGGIVTRSVIAAWLTTALIGCAPINDAGMEDEGGNPKNNKSVERARQFTHGGLMKFIKKATAGAMAVGVVVAMLGGVAFAQRATSYEVDYYSDATFTDLVGHRDVNCDGPIHTSGTVTAFAVQSNEYACGDGRGEWHPAPNFSPNPKP